MSTGVKILLWLHLIAALSFLLSAVITLGSQAARWAGRKVFAFFSECLDGAAREVR